MMKCPKCNKDVEQNWRFCPFCEASLEEREKCPSCGKQMEPAWKSCPFCGRTESGKTGKISEIKWTSRQCEIPRVSFEEVLECLSSIPVYLADDAKSDLREFTSQFTAESLVLFKEICEWVYGEDGLGYEDVNGDLADAKEMFRLVAPESFSFFKDVHEWVYGEDGLGYENVNCDLADAKEVFQLVAPESFAFFKDVHEWVYGEDGLNLSFVDPNTSFQVAKELAEVLVPDNFVLFKAIYDWALGEDGLYLEDSERSCDVAKELVAKLTTNDELARFKELFDKGFALHEDTEEALNYARKAYFG